MTDAMEAVGQDVDQEATDELVDVERHQLVARFGLGPVILPPEGHVLAVENDEPGYWRWRSGAYSETGRRASTASGPPKGRLA